MEGIVESDNGHLGRGVLYGFLRRATPALSRLDLSNAGAKKDPARKEDIFRNHGKVERSFEVWQQSLLTLTSMKLSWIGSLV